MPGADWGHSATVPAGMSRPWPPGTFSTGAGPITERRNRSTEYRRPRLGLMKLLDDIRLEVKNAYLAMRDLEENIKTVELAIEQARENYRIFTERYKEQVSTQTDVLIAQTLLSRTQTNYYNALYDYKRAKAALLRAMGSGGLAENEGR